LAEPILPGHPFPEHVDYILHGAASVSQQSRDYGVIDANVRSTFNVMRFAEEVGAKAVVHLSSVAVYGASASRRTCSEDSPAVPNSNYGLSKLLAEHVVASAAPSVRRLNLRLTYVLNAGMAASTLIHRLATALHRDQPVELVNASETFFQFIDADDVARACEAALQNDLQGTFNLSSPETPTLGQLFERIQDSVGKSASNVTLKSDPAVALRTIYPADRFVSAVGGFDFTPLDASIRRATGDSS
jgi:nucleoside-diphosphate-sugar epimerase